MGADNKKIVEMLNEALADEMGQYLEMATQAAITSGEQALYLKSFLESQAAGALDHAAKLRERVYFLGGTPSMKVGPAKLHASFDSLAKAGVEDHRRFVDTYRKLLVSIKRTDGDLLYETIEELLEAEQRDLEAWTRLAGQVR